MQLALLLDDANGAARLMAEMRWETHMLQARGSLNGLELERASVLVRLGDTDKALAILNEGIGHHPLPTPRALWGVMRTLT